MFFCGENIPNPLDSSKTGDYWNCSRNIGYVKVGKQLTQGQECILSDGPVQEGGFYTFGGTLQKQTMKGVRWLTKFSGEENVSRLKSANFGQNILVIFEVWNKSAYLNTQYLIVRPDGSATEPVKLPIKLKFHKADDIFYDKERSVVVFYAGEKGKLLSRY